MLSEEKKIKDVLDFLLESYGDRLATAELQQLFLERRQKHGKSVRDYAVDIERRFFRLTRHDKKLYSCPDTTLADQFIEGLGDSYIRNTCRDRFEQGTVKAFRELQEYAIKREGREEAKDKSKGPSNIFNSALHLGDGNAPRSEDLLQVFREMSDRAVEAGSKTTAVIWDKRTLQQSSTSGRQLLQLRYNRPFCEGMPIKKTIIPSKI